MKCLSRYLQELISSRELFILKSCLVKSIHTAYYKLLMHSLGLILINISTHFYCYSSYTRQTSKEAISPPRPCYLPISEPIPVPCNRNVAQQPSSPSTNARSGSSVVPRSQPISMKRSVDSHRSHPPDIGSLSPPSVQFVIGTPPGRKYDHCFISLFFLFSVYCKIIWSLWNLESFPLLFGSGSKNLGGLNDL